MPREVRCILFDDIEARQVVRQLLDSRRERGATVDVARLEFVAGLKGPSARVFFAGNSGQQANVTMDSMELINAMLMECAKLRIPLPSRALKSVEYSGDNLILLVVNSHGGMVTDAGRNAKIASRLALGVARTRPQAVEPPMETAGAAEPETPASPGK